MYKSVLRKINKLQKEKVSMTSFKKIYILNESLSKIKVPNELRHSDPVLKH